VFKKIRQHLGVKLFLSYLAVILAVVFVLGVVLELALPTSFYNHILPMMEMMESPMQGMGMMGEGSGHSFYTGFRNAVNQALVWSGLAALVAALVVSVLVSRRVVAPVQEMKAVSQRIAGGNYDQRVKVQDSPETGGRVVPAGCQFQPDGGSFSPHRGYAPTVDRRCVP
jgi:histidine kinase